MNSLPSQRTITLFLLVLGCAICIPAATTCDCGYGSVSSVSPCTCTCDTGYALPNCLYLMDQTARIYLALGINQTDLVSSSLIDALLLYIGEPRGSNDVLFRGVLNATDQGNSAVVRFAPLLVIEIGMVARHINGFLDDVELGENSILLDQHIQAAELVKVVGAEKKDIGTGFIIYSNDLVTVSLNTVGWLAGALVVCCLLCWCEKCCLNRGLPSQEDMAVEEIWRRAVQKKHRDSPPPEADEELTTFDEGGRLSPRDESDGTAIFISAKKVSPEHSPGHHPLKPPGEDELEVEECP